VPNITTEAPAEVSPAQTMKALSEQRLAAMDPKPSKPKAETKPVADSAKVEKPEGASTVAESAAKDPAAKPESPTSKPANETAPDLSFAPEDLREFFSSNPKAAKYLREWYGDYTTKTQAASAAQKAVEDERKTLDSRKVAADFGDAVMADADALDALRAVAAKRAGSTAAQPEAEVFDWDAASNEEKSAYVARERKRAAAEAIEALEGKQRSTSQAESDRKADGAAQYAAVKASLIDTGEATWETADAVYLNLIKDGVKFTKDNVVGTLRKYLPPKAEKPAERPQDSPTANGVSRSGSSGASPLTRAGGTTAPLPLPAFMREGREPANRDERLAWALSEVNRKRIARGDPPITRS